MLYSLSIYLSLHFFSLHTSLSSSLNLFSTQNDLKELWSLLNLLLPNVFNNVKTFNDWFSQPFQKEDPTHNIGDDWLETEKKVIIIHRLHQILEPFMLRRRVEDVEGSLPPKVSIFLRSRMSAIQSAIYDWIKSTGTLRADPEVEESRTQKNPTYQPRTYKTLNNRCMELRKACNHPFLNYPYFSDFSKDFLVRSCGKLWVLDRILIKLQRTGHHVLLFSTMTKLLDILEEYLQWRRLEYRRIDGKTSLDDRESAIMDFNSPDTDCFIFLLSIRAAGRGLNLQSADTVIIYDPDPNPKNEEQAVARAHRIGQTRQVKVIYLEAVVHKMSSHQKEDEFQRGGIVDSEDDLAGKDRYMGSIESLIRRNIQQHKIDMANEVIDAGRFDQKTTHEERRLTLETLLHEEKYQATVHDVPSLQQINRMIARSEEEVELFDQMDEIFEWTKEMTRYDEVPQWLRASTKEVNAAIAKLSKKPSKSTLFGSSYGVDDNELPSEAEKQRGRPKRKKFAIHTEDDRNGEFSDASSLKSNGFDKEGEINQFEGDEVSGAIGSSPLKVQSEDYDAMSSEGLEWPGASESAKNNCVVEKEGSPGSSLDNQRASQLLSTSVFPQKLGSFSALDARPGSHSKWMSDEIGDEEIAVSGDSHVDVRQSGCWTDDCDEGEDEQVVQPKIKRKRSIRVRRWHIAENPEEKFNDRPTLQHGGSQMPLYKYGSQNRKNYGHKAHAKPSTSANDGMGSALNNRQGASSGKVSTTATFKCPLKSGRGSGIISSANDASEHSRDNWETKVTNGSGTSGKCITLPKVIRRKCKSVITRLQKTIDEEGEEIMPMLTDLWKRNEESSSVHQLEDSLLDLQTIDLRVEKSYAGVNEFVADMQLMIRNAVRYYGFSHEVKYEAERVHEIFFDILKMAFPKNHFPEAWNSTSCFAGPVSPTTTGSSSRSMLAARSKRRKMGNDVEPDPLHSQKSWFRGAGGHEIGPEDAQSAHPGNLVVCKGKRKDRERSAIKPGCLSAGPVSPPHVSHSGTSTRTAKQAKGMRLGQHTTQQGWGSQSPRQASSGSGSGSGSVGWANPVKRMRTSVVKRRPPSNFLT